MSQWTITSCSVSDGAALARNNMSAFWTDPNWNLLWPNVTLDFLIEQATLRLPRNLLRDRDSLRHEKAVDPVTGVVVGYARWLLPAHMIDGSRRSIPWEVAVVPDVGPDERAEIERHAEGAWWKPRELGNMDEESNALKHRILEERRCMSLDYLAVHPDNKGKGIASALVASGVRAAEVLGIDVFVLGFQAAEGVYRRLGFKDVADPIIQDDSIYGGTGEYIHYFLIREVDKKKSEEPKGSE